MQLAFASVSRVLLASVVMLTLGIGIAHADSFTVVIGDKDGFGFSTPCPATGTCLGLSNPSIDNRSAAEAAATNGAQLTDIYSALYPGQGPNNFLTGDVILPFSGTLLSGVLSFDGGDFQSNVFRAMTASIDGVSVPFSFSDGRFADAIHSFTLTPEEIAVANTQGYVDLHLDRSGSGDFVAFDYFQLDGTTTTVAVTPEPSSLILLGSGILVAAGTLRRRFAV